MTTKPLGQVFSALCLYLALLGCASAADSKVIPMGDDTFSITRQAGTAFTRDAGGMKAIVKQEAEDYCAAQNKVLKVVSLTSDKPAFMTGYVKAKIVFKALSPGDAELAPAGSTITVNGTQVAAGAGDMYSDLIKLEDLHKKGILTDDEFQSEKKKILNRSK